MSWKNPVKERMQRGEPVFGATITVPNTDVAARLAASGFDFLWFEMEHSPITLESVRDMILATRPFPALPLLRIPINETWTAKRALDVGAAGVIFPFTSTPELARQAVAACKYPPIGRRGSGAGLASFRWPFANYFDTADSEFLVITVIEEARALDSIDEIAATEGIDALFIGTSDLSFSLGLRGSHDSPVFRDAMETIVGAARRHGKFVGRPAFPPENVPQYIEQGFQFFQADTDLNYLAAGARGFLAPRGRALKSEDLAL